MDPEAGVTYTILVCLVLFVVIYFMEQRAYQPTSNISSFNDKGLLDWPQYGPYPRPQYNPDNVILETIPYLRSDRPFFDSADYAYHGDPLEYASTAIANDKIVKMLQRTGPGGEDRFVANAQSRLQTRAARTEGFVEGFDPAPRLGTKNLDPLTFGTYGLNTYDRDEHFDDRPIMTGSTMNPNGTETTGMVFRPAVAPLDLGILSQNHPIVLSEKHRIATQVNNRLPPTSVRQNLEKTLIADVLRERQIPKSFGGA